MIGQDADCDGLERVAPLNGLIDAPQAIDFFDQKLLGRCARTTVKKKTLPLART
jgi:hypothetical protein